VNHTLYGRYQLIDMAESSNHQMNAESFSMAEDAVRHLLPACYPGLLAFALAPRLNTLIDQDIQALHTAVEADLLRRTTLRLTS
jgi:hypothetical protein